MQIIMEELHEVKKGDVFSPYNSSGSPSNSNSNSSESEEGPQSSFLFLGPVGKKRKIIREKAILANKGLTSDEEDHHHEPHEKIQSLTLSVKRDSVTSQQIHLLANISNEKLTTIKIKDEPLDFSFTHLPKFTSPYSIIGKGEDESEDSGGSPEHHHRNIFSNRRRKESLHSTYDEGSSNYSDYGLSVSASSSPSTFSTSSVIVNDFGNFIKNNNIIIPRQGAVDKSGANGGSNKKKFKCPECEKEFTQLRNYRYHRSRHEGSKLFSCTCPICGKTFNDKGYISSHLKIHRNAKEYKCEFCSKSFNQRVAYNMHVRIHTNYKPHQCEYCAKAFSRKMLLRQHLRTHTGERPYKCDVCQKAFADRSNMLLHQRLHSGERPFKCDICEKAFSKKHHLKTHLNQHAGIKPYHCSKCNARFSQSSNMKTHFRKCTGILPTPGNHNQNLSGLSSLPGSPLKMNVLRITNSGASYPITSPAIQNNIPTFASAFQQQNAYFQQFPSLYNHHHQNKSVGGSTYNNTTNVVTPLPADFQASRLYYQLAQSTVSLPPPPSPVPTRAPNANEISISNHHRSTVITSSPSHNHHNQSHHHHQIFSQANNPHHPTTLHSVPNLVKNWSFLDHYGEFPHHNINR